MQLVLESSNVQISSLKYTEGVLYIDIRCNIVTFSYIDNHMAECREPWVRFSRGAKCLFRVQVCGCPMASPTLEKCQWVSIGVKALFYSYFYQLSCGSTRVYPERWKPQSFILANWNFIYLQHQTIKISLRYFFSLSKTRYIVINIFI